MTVELSLVWWALGVVIVAAIAACVAIVVIVWLPLPRSTNDKRRPPA
jgi:hypothetical protein